VPVILPGTSTDRPFDFHHVLTWILASRTRQAERQRRGVARLRLPRVPRAQSAFRTPTGRREPRTAGPVVLTPASESASCSDCLAGDAVQRERARAPRPTGIVFLIQALRPCKDSKREPCRRTAAHSHATAHYGRMAEHSESR
jgi:hypothetical protein